MRYYYLKIGAANCHARKWLSKDNELRRPAVLIFFDNRPETDYAADVKGLNPQSRDFYRCGIQGDYARTRILVIFEGQLWILEPEGKVRFLKPIPEETGGETLTRKVMPVRVLSSRNLKEVPAVLAGLPANQYLCRGTFRKINHWGNLKAADRVLETLEGIAPDWNSEHWASDAEKSAQLLECLGSTGLETLAARVFEAGGCFVPARTGGTLKDIDLFVYNDTSSGISFNAGTAILRIPPKSCRTIQIKTWPDKSDQFKAAAVDFLIAFRVKGPGTYDANWLLAVALQYPTVRDWLFRALNWLPKKFINEVLKDKVVPKAPM